jgi:hypothetical protein
MKLSQSEIFHLVDCLRRSLLYQTSTPVFLGEEAQTPDHFIVRLKAAHYIDVMQLIQKAGGWELSGEQREALLKHHEEKAKIDFGDGKTYSFDHLDIGDLYNMHKETRSMPEL